VQPALVAIPVLCEFVLLLTVGSPLFLTGRMDARPQLGIIAWLASFTLSALAATAALSIACLGLFETYASLETSAPGSSSWYAALAVSFAPWLILALAGIGLAQLSQLFGPRLAEARDARNFLEEISYSDKTVSGLKIVELAVDAPFVAVTKIRGRSTVLATTGAIAILKAEELSAVLEHERAHVALRHLEARACANFLYALTPWLATSRLMRVEVDRLSELAADARTSLKFDQATIRSARKKLATDF